MTFLKPLHLFEVYLYEATKKNAFSIMNSEPTSTIRKKIYADRYEISSGGLTFFQSAKNASDELVDVPVISFPAGKWESVSLIRNRIIIAEHKTGASSGASHISIQSELKKNKTSTGNSFKIIQMPPNGKDTEKEITEINKLMEQVNKLVDSQKEILEKAYLPPSKLVGKIFQEEKVDKSVVKESVIAVKEESPKAKQPSQDVVEVEKKSYSKETIERHKETQKTEDSNLWDSVNSLDEPPIEPEVESEPEPLVHEIEDNNFDDFSIDIDEITASLEQDGDFVGEEIKNDPQEQIAIKVNKKPEEPVPEVKVERKPAPQPKVEVTFDDSSDDIMGLLDSLSDDQPELSNKEIKEKKKEFILSNLTSYLKVVEIFKFDQFQIYLEGEAEYQKYGIKDYEIYWEISQLLLEQGISPRKFIKEKLQKHISLILPSIMKKSWDGSIINILDIAKEHNEIKDITLIDLAVWLAQNGYK